MDIAGAKALKERLGRNGTYEAAPASVDVHEDAPPVFHWFGVRQPAPEVGAEDGLADQSVSLFRRPGLSFR
jgi:hypothetical protein